MSLLTVYTNIPLRRNCIAPETLCCICNAFCLQINGDSVRCDLYNQYKFLYVHESGSLTKSIDAESSLKRNAIATERSKADEKQEIKYYFFPRQPFSVQAGSINERRKL